jgi:hypothetical protein
MYVGVDKAAAVRMYDYVREAWAEHLAELKASTTRCRSWSGRGWLARIALMESTDRRWSSPGQNEIASSSGTAGYQAAPRPDEHRGPGPRDSRPLAIHCAWCSWWRCG